NHRNNPDDRDDDDQFDDREAPLVFPLHSHHLRSGATIPVDSAGRMAEWEVKKISEGRRPSRKRSTLSCLLCPSRHWTAQPLTREGAPLLKIGHTHHRCRLDICLFVAFLINLFALAATPAFAEPPRWQVLKTGRTVE